MRLRVALVLSVASALRVESPRRRALLGAAVVGARSPASAVTPSRFEGTYADPNHPSGYRRISVVGATATVVGRDEPSAPEWRLRATTDGDAIALELDAASVQPSDGVSVEEAEGGRLAPVFRGVLVDDGIAWADGNTWSRAR